MSSLCFFAPDVEPRCRLQCAAPSIDPLKWEADAQNREELKARISQNANRYRRGPSLKMPRTTNAFIKSAVGVVEARFPCRGSEVRKIMKFMDFHGTMMRKF